MRDRLYHLGKQIVVYGIGGAALQGIGLITLPIYARIFRPAQYGVLEVATIGFAALLLMVDTGMVSAAQRSYFDYEDDQVNERKSTLSTALVVMLTLALLVAILLFVFDDQISRALFDTSRRGDLVRIVGVSVPVATLGGYLREVMRLRFQAWRYVTSTLLGGIGTAAGGIVAVTVFQAGISGAVLGTLIGYGASALYGLVYAGRDVIGRFSRPELMRMLRYGLPLIPAAFAMWGLSFLDRVMLSKLGGFAETGEYAIGSRYAMVLMFCMGIFMTAYLPFMFSLWGEDREVEMQVRGRVLNYVILMLITVGLVLSLFARELTDVVAPQFDRAYLVVGVLCIGMVLYGVALIVSSAITLVRQTKYFAPYTALATGLNVGLNFVLIPLWGMIGAASATTAAYGLLAALYYRKAQQICHTPYLTGRALTALLIGCPLMGVGAISIKPEALGLLVKLTALMVFALTIWWRRLIDEEELRTLLAAARRLRPRSSAAVPMS